MKYFDDRENLKKKHAFFTCLLPSQTKKYLTVIWLQIIYGHKKQTALVIIDYKPKQPTTSANLYDQSREKGN